MKRFTLALILSLCGLISIVNGQDFTYTAPLTQQPGNHLELTRFYSQINNLSTQDQNFLIIKDGSNLPPGWTLSFCFGTTCFPPFVDSSEGLIPAGSFDSVLVDFIPDSAYSDGWCTMSVQPVGHPELADTIDFHVFFTSTGFAYTATIREELGTPDQLTRFHSELFNTTDQDQEFYVIKDPSLIPSAWTCSFCVGATCYPPFVDTVTVIIPANSYDSVLVDITPTSQPNDGWATMTVFPVNSPGLAESITYHVYLGAAVQENPVIPTRHDLMTAYPNPFNPDLTLAIALDRPSVVELGIYNLQGGKVADLYSGHLSAGQHQFKWQAEGMTSGIYLARIALNGQSTLQKVVLLK
ncbi:MAG: T9SS type A sorting domain-containing protein [bacterium]|nr:T9SS type A sorting domain-containing protein [bacterium]